MIGSLLHTAEYEVYGRGQGTMFLDETRLFSAENAKAAVCGSGG